MPEQAPYSRSKKPFIARLTYYLWGTIRHPGPTFAELAGERHILTGALPILVYFGLALVHGLLRNAIHGQQIGSEPMLADPTFVGGFGYLRLSAEAYRRGWATVFVAVMLPTMWIAAGGFAYVLSRLWGGKGSFEANLNTIGFAIFVPWLVIQSTSEIIFGIPFNLMFDTAFWWVEAMMGVYGPTVALVWNIFVIGIYSTLTYLWSILLAAAAVRKTNGVSTPAALLTAVISFGLAVFLFSLVVR